MKAVTWNILQVHCFFCALKVYQTQDDGSFAYDIWLAKNQIVKVWIMDLFENGVDYECEVEILQIEREEGRERNYPIIFINPNGDCHVDSSLEYLLD